MSNPRTPLVSSPISETSKALESMLKDLESLITSRSSIKSINSLCENIEESLINFSKSAPSSSKELRVQSTKSKELRQRFESLIDRIESEDLKSEQIFFHELDKDLLKLRQHQTQALEVKMNTVKEVMQECNELTVEQGLMLDRIDLKLEETKKNTSQVKVELEKTKKRQSYKKATCIIIVLISLLFFIGVVVVAFILGH